MSIYLFYVFVDFISYYKNKNSYIIRVNWDKY